MPSIARRKTLVNTDDDAEQAVKEDDCGQRAVAWLLFSHVYGFAAAMKI